MTQLIPKTKIPAHTRYALQCRFSPDSTYVLGPGGKGNLQAVGMTWCVVSSYEVVTATKTPHVRPQASCHLFG